MYYLNPLYFLVNNITLVRPKTLSLHFFNSLYFMDVKHNYLLGRKNNIIGIWVIRLIKAMDYNQRGIIHCASDAGFHPCPGQQSFATRVLSDEKGDIELKLRAVHRSPGIYFTDVGKKTRISELGDSLQNIWKFFTSNEVPFHHGFVNIKHLIIWKEGVRKKVLNVHN